LLNQILPDTFPWFDGTRYDIEQRMRSRRNKLGKERSGRASGELRSQQELFVEELALSDSQSLDWKIGMNATPIEAIAADRSLFVQSHQKATDGGHRIGGAPKSVELRMCPVSNCETFKHSLRKQCLAPGSDKPFRIKIRRM